MRIQKQPYQSLFLARFRVQDPPGSALGGLRIEPLEQVVRIHIRFGSKYRHRKPLRPNSHHPREYTASARLASRPTVAGTPFTGSRSREINRPTSGKYAKRRSLAF